MKTQEFIALLKEQPNKQLVFEYTPGNYVAPNYHITEVKNVSIDSVDCGAGIDSWKETIVQLWESPEEKDALTYMTAAKALGILDKVHQIRPMEQNVEIKFEYSNKHFHTAQLFVNDFAMDSTKLLLKLGVEQTDCKAKDACGIPAAVAVADNGSCCTPESGCC